MMGNINNSKDSGFTSGYYLCRNAEEVVDAIDKGRIVYTGSKFFDRKATYGAKDSILRFGKYSGGHLMCLSWYDLDDELFYMPNSRGEHRFDGWVNYLRFKDFDKMFSMIALVDVSDAHIISRAKKDREMLEKAKAAGYWNGLNPDIPSKRYEAVLMIMRGKYEWADDTTVLAQSVLDGIWSWNNKDGNVTRGEAIIIIMRGLFGKFDSDLSLYTQAKNLWVWNWLNPDMSATRSQVMLMVMRAKWIVGK